MFLGKLHLSIMALAATTLTTGCATNETQEVRTPITTTEERAAADLDRNVVSSITFAKGQRGLSADTTAELDRALEEARKIGEVDTVDIAVWSDMEYPAKNKSLPQSQINLASDRGENVEAYIDRRAASASTTVHNMAKEPSGLAKFFNTSDSKLKEKLASAGIVKAGEETHIPARSSTALVFIKVK